MKAPKLAAALAALCLAASVNASAREASSEPRARSNRSSAPPAELSSATVSRSQAVHAGKLSPVDECKNIDEQANGLTTIADSDVRVGYRIEKPRGWYEFQDGVLSWRDPLPRETHYVLVSVQGASDRRVLPGCKVTIAMANPDGQEIVSSAPLSFRWDPQFNHYGANVSLGESPTTVTLHVRVAPPEFSRMGQLLGSFFTQPVATSWPGVSLPSRAESAPPDKNGQSPDQGVVLEGRHPPLEPTPYPGARPN